MTPLNVTYTPAGTFCHSRILFGKFNAENDIDLVTRRVGVRSHCTLVGIILWLFGKATALQHASGDTLYVNTNSLNKWFQRHSVTVVPSNEQAINLLSAPPVSTSPQTPIPPSSNPVLTPQQTPISSNSTPALTSTQTPTIPANEGTKNVLEPAKAVKETQEKLKEIQANQNAAKTAAAKAKAQGHWKKIQPKVRAVGICTKLLAKARVKAQKEKLDAERSHIYKVQDYVNDVRDVALEFCYNTTVQDLSMSNCMHPVTEFDLWPGGKQGRKEELLKQAQTAKQKYGELNKEAMELEGEARQNKFLEAERYRKEEERLNYLANDDVLDREVTNSAWKHRPQLFPISDYPRTTIYLNDADKEAALKDQSTANDVVLFQKPVESPLPKDGIFYYEPSKYGTSQDPFHYRTYNEPCNRSCDTGEGTYFSLTPRAKAIKVKINTDKLRVAYVDAQNMKKVTEEISLLVNEGLFKEKATELQKAVPESLKGTDNNERMRAVKHWLVQDFVMRQGSLKGNMPSEQGYNAVYVEKSVYGPAYFNILDFLKVTDKDIVTTLN